MRLPQNPFRPGEMLLEEVSRSRQDDSSSVGAEAWLDKGTLERVD